VAIEFMSQEARIMLIDREQGAPHTNGPGHRIWERVEPLNKRRQLETLTVRSGAVEAKSAAMRVRPAGDADGLGKLAHVVSHQRLCDDPTSIANGVVEGATGRIEQERVTRP
jgi:hypothetical protein